MSSNAGLGALSGGRRDLLMIDPRDLTVEDGLNVRDFEAAENRLHIEFLKTSIRIDGVKQPLTVRYDDGKAVVTDGECRLRAVMELIAEGTDIKRLPCQPEGRGINAQQRTIDLAVRNSGKPFTPMEMASLCARLLGYGMEQQEIARRLGMSASNVSHLLSLREMPEQVQDMVREGAVSAATALKTVRSEGPEEAAAILTEAREEAQSGEVVPLTGAEGNEPKPAKKVTQKKIEAAKERRSGVTAEPKPLKASVGSRLDDALLTQVKKFLGKCMDGTYDNEEDEVPERLVSDAKQMAETIKFYERGFTSEAAE